MAVSGDPALPGDEGSAQSVPDFTRYTAGTWGQPDWSHVCWELGRQESRGNGWLGPGNTDGKSGGEERPRVSRGAGRDIRPV